MMDAVSHQPPHAPLATGPEVESPAPARDEPVARPRPLQDIPHPLDPLYKAAAEGLASVSAFARRLGAPLPDPSLPQEESERLALYRAALAQAETEDFQDYAQLQCLHLGGRDRAGSHHNRASATRSLCRAIAVCTQSCCAR